MVFEKKQQLKKNKTYEKITYKPSSKIGHFQQKARSFYNNNPELCRMVKNLQQAKNSTLQFPADFAQDKF